MKKNNSIIEVVDNPIPSLCESIYYQIHLMAVERVITHGRHMVLEGPHDYGLQPRTCQMGIARLTRGFDEQTTIIGKRYRLKFF